MEDHNVNLERDAPVWQAQGVVSVQAACSVDEAMRMIEDRAQISHQSIWQIAIEVIDHQIRFN